MFVLKKAYIYIYFLGLWSMNEAWFLSTLNPVLIKPRSVDHDTCVVVRLAGPKKGDMKRLSQISERETVGLAIEMPWSGI